MSYQPEVYTVGHVLGMTGMVAVGTLLCYMHGMASEDVGMKWFAENWLLYLGIGATFFTFLFGLTIVGTPCYDEETNNKLSAEHDRAMFEWKCKSPEEKAILVAAEENKVLQLMQILQNRQILDNQERLKKNKRC